MKLNLKELKIIEEALRSKLNDGYEDDIAELHKKVTKRISDIEGDIARTIEWLDAGKRRTSR